MSEESLLPVTALEFCVVSGSELLLAGEGPKLKLFNVSKSGNLAQTQSEVLPFGKIHGIRPASSVRPAGVVTVAVFGQKSLRILRIEVGENTARVSFKTDVLLLSDWLLDVCWLQEEEESWKLAAITAHNVALVCTIVSDGGMDVSSYHNEVNCILYSARVVGASTESLTVASGTVFNQILLWHIERVQPLDRVKVQLTLSGHEGVIFSMRFSSDQSQLVSVSDDRTIRLWSLPQDWKQLDRSAECCYAAAVLVLYGHTARVWDARLLPRGVVSVGEDATARVWDFNGRCTEVIEGHKGRGIWSLAVSGDNTMIATGGGDCSIRMSTLRAHNNSAQLVAVDTYLPSSDAAASSDVPRLVGLKHTTALCLTNTGVLYATDLSELSQPSLSWRELGRDARFAGYCTMAVCPALGVVALGNLRGEVKVQALDEKASSGHESSVLKVCEGKIFSLYWSREQPEATWLLFATAPEGKILCFRVGMRVRGGAVAVSKVAVGFNLPPSRHRWLSAVAVLERKTFIIGDRRGSVYVYRSEAQTSDDRQTVFLDAVQAFRGVHGPNGVTCVEVHNGSVYTAGRDGHCRKFAVNSEGTLIEVNKFKPVKGMDWIEQIHFTAKDLIVLGFHATDLVLHSTAQNKFLFRVHCGGGHRSYGLTSIEEVLSRQAASVVFIKQSCVWLRSVALCSTDTLIQQAFVGREAVSIAVLHYDHQNGAGLVAVGSEDCTVCVLSIQLCNDGEITINVLRFLQAHISSVRALAVSPSPSSSSSSSSSPSSSPSSSSSPCRSHSHDATAEKRTSRERLLFSGGSRASLKVWTLADVCGANCEASLGAELHLHGKQGAARRRHKASQQPATGFPPECRVMSLAAAPLSDLTPSSSSSSSSSFPSSSSGCLHYLAVGCSDGIVRQFLYSEGSRQFTELQQLVFHERCILAVELFKAKQGSLLFTTATDGTVAVWLVDHMIPKDSQAADHMISKDSQTADHMTPKDSQAVDHMIPKDSQSADHMISHDDLQSVKALNQANAYPSAHLRLHQSGINAIDVTATTSDVGCWVATGGDDNALSVTLCRVEEEEEEEGEGGRAVVSLEKHCLLETAHSSSITGVRFLPGELLVTTSVDQRLNVWQLTAASLQLVASHTYDVADSAAMTAFPTRDGAMVVLCGVGIQCFYITPGDKLATHCKLDSTQRM